MPRKRTPEIPEAQVKNLNVIPTGYANGHTHMFFLADGNQDAVFGVLGWAARTHPGVFEQVYNWYRRKGRKAAGNPDSLSAADRAFLKSLGVAPGGRRNAT